MEYMALGKPVIATEGGGTGDIIDNNKTGFIISPKNPEILSNLICKIIDNSELCGEMGKAGQHRIKEYFSIELMVNRYIEAYKKMMPLKLT